MMFNNLCGKCNKNSDRCCWAIVDVKFKKKLCPSCSTEVYNEIMDAKWKFHEFGYFQEYKSYGSSSQLSIYHGDSCAVAVKPDFSKEKGNIKKGEIEEEVC